METRLSVQGDEAWHEKRIGHVTASRFSDCMTKARSGGGLSKTAESYLYELVASRLTGLPIPSISSKATDWGNSNEEGALSCYTGDSYQGEIALVDFVVHPDEEWVGCSPDGLVGEFGLVEIKCPFNSREHVRNLLTRQVPKDYLWQVQGQLWVTGREWCDFISYDPRVEGLNELMVLRVERDEDLIKQLSDEVLDFRDQVCKAYDRLTKERTDG